MAIQKRWDKERWKAESWGLFWLTGASTAKAFNSKEHIKGAHIIFMPETKADATGKRSKVFLAGLKLEELPENRIEKEP